MFKKKYRESEEFLKRQQNIDAVLVLVRVLEVSSDKDIVAKTYTKITQLLDKI